MSMFKRMGKLSEPKQSLLSGAAKMDKTVERTLARKIIRLVAVNMKPYGYVLTKPTFLGREEPLLISFFHFHKYRSGPYIRVHFGVRVLNDDFQALALNGPEFSNSTQYGYEAGEADVERCVANITALLVSTGLPWNNSWSDVDTLLSTIGDPRTPLKRDSSPLKRHPLSKSPLKRYPSLLERHPLSDSERQWLMEAQSGQSSEENVALSRLLLGIKPAQPAP